MLTPELFARVIEKCGEAARPRYDKSMNWLSHDRDGWKFRGVSYDLCRVAEPEAHNACVVHWQAELHKAVGAIIVSPPDCTSSYWEIDVAHPRRNIGAGETLIEALADALARAVCAEGE